MCEAVRKGETKVQAMEWKWRQGKPASLQCEVRETDDKLGLVERQPCEERPFVSCAASSLGIAWDYADPDHGRKESRKSELSFACSSPEAASWEEAVLEARGYETRARLHSLSSTMRDSSEGS